MVSLTTCCVVLSVSLILSDWKLSVRVSHVISIFDEFVLREGHAEIRYMGIAVQ
jgi:hypothetical protein